MLDLVIPCQPLSILKGGLADGRTTTLTYKTIPINALILIEKPVGEYVRPKVKTINNNKGYIYQYQPYLNI